jgi:hypothetical protein
MVAACQDSFAPRVVSEGLWLKGHRGREGTRWWPEETICELWGSSKRG